MRSFLFALTFALSTAGIHAAAPQGVPPRVPPSPPTCYRLRPVEIPGENHQFARILTGDKWISGCVGPAGRCFIAIWVPC